MLVFNGHVWEALPFEVGVPIINGEVLMDRSLYPQPVACYRDIPVPTDDHAA
jgi:hypothetical protein